MRWPALPLVIVLAGPAAGGCAVLGEPCESPVTGTATYVSGSTPPPWHHAWTVRLEKTTGTVPWTPGYGSSESWSATFTPDDDRFTTACQAVREAVDSDPPPGGGTLTVRWRGEGGRTTALTTSDERAADAVRAAVPTAAWEQAEGAYERWRDARRR